MEKVDELELREIVREREKESYVVGDGKKAGSIEQVERRLNGQERRGERIREIRERDDWIGRNEE